MADSITIARPYARAVFEHARSENSLSPWSVMLQDLAQIVLDKNAAQFLTNPAGTLSQQCELLMTGLFGLKRKPGLDVANFIQTLAYNKRLQTLPHIVLLFDTMRAEEEKTMQVFVSAFQALSDAESEKLTKVLSQRLNRQVTLNVSIDKNLLGGAIIRADNLVIDGSVRGKINKLRAALAA